VLIKSKIKHARKFNPGVPSQDNIPLKKGFFKPFKQFISSLKSRLPDNNVKILLFSVSREKTLQNLKNPLEKSFLQCYVIYYTSRSGGMADALDSKSGTL
jgi:hypothetical protein